ncbi:alpha-galactosidase [Myxococcota bacterium]
MPARSLIALCLMTLVMALAACSDGNGDDGKTMRLTGDGFEVVLDVAKGTYDVLLDDGTLVLERAFGEVELGEPGDPGNPVFRTTSRYLRSATKESVTDELGGSTRIELKCTDLEDAPDLTLWLAIHAEHRLLTARIMAENTGEEDILLARLVPAKVTAEKQGALWIGRHPSQTRILEAGSFFLFEFFVDLVPGDVAKPEEADLLGLIHGYQQGHSISNWDHAIYDQESGHAFVAGALDFEFSSPMFNTAFVPEDAEDRDGRTPFTYWSAEFPYLPTGKPVAPGATHAAGPVAIIPDRENPHQALEEYALALKAQYDIRLWPARGPENRVPNGWNSWTGSGSSGGYGTDIDQQLMLDNLAAMAEEFKDFGVEWFQIDDGYEWHYGDWDWRADRFPDGSAWLADQIELAGLIPGVWIAPFQVSGNSDTYATHQADGWFAPKQPYLGGDDMQIPDLTHPEVLAWIEDRFRQIRADGYRWLKTDFVYWALGGKSYHDPTATREEAYRRGLAAIRAGMDAGAVEAGGEAGDYFWISVSMHGPHTGFPDAIRPNLDTMPSWDAEDPAAGRKSEQGFKASVRSMVRRFYLQNRAYIMHHDLLLFRAHKDTNVPALTADEARCLLTAMAMTGSVAKLGERIVEMQPAWINDYRRVLPVYGLGARPLDIFEREFAEIWHLPVVPEEGLNTPGKGPAYDVIALFNWGTNVDLTTNPYTDMPDAARTVSVDLAALGLDETYLARDFWFGEVIEVTGTLSRTVQPHTVQAFALRKKENHPQFIGNNRHVFQGAVEILDIAWDDGPKTLSMTYDAAPGSTKAPFTHELVFYVPAGFTLQNASVSGSSDVQTAVADNVLTLSFTVGTRQNSQITLTF